MQPDLKVALVTGSGRGLGRAIAVELARRGVAVVVNAATNIEQAHETRDIVSSFGVPAMALRADVSNESDVDCMFRQVAARFGRLDVLVNNAGINRDICFASMSVEHWKEVMDTNLTGTFLCTKAALPLMQTAGAGSVVNITARTALRARTHGANYCASKAAVSMLTRCLALELSPTVRVNAVAPGTTDTEEIRHRYSLDTAEGVDAIESSIPLRRIASPEEIARLVVFVALDAHFMTGEEVLIDGGRNLV